MSNCIACVKYLFEPTCIDLQKNQEKVKAGSTHLLSMYYSAKIFSKSDIQENQSQSTEI